MAYATAHEIGHYLGLTHESAFNKPENLMYPRLGGLCRGRLNDEQIFIMQHMPIVQARGVVGHRTPIHKLQVVVQTGTKWPTPTDGPGTNLNVLFGLESADGNGKNWDLDNWGDDFEAGATNTFSLVADDLVVQCDYLQPSGG